MSDQRESEPKRRAGLGPQDPEDVQPGDTDHLGAVETDMTHTDTPVPGDAGDPQGEDPTKETPGG